VVSTSAADEVRSVLQEIAQHAAYPPSLKYPAPRWQRQGSRSEQKSIWL